MKQKEESMSQQIGDILDELAQQGTDSKDIYQLDNESLQIKDVDYMLVKDYREAFDFEAFKIRYQDYFEKFDFIVGDWGYEQLRLRGFYQLNQKRVPVDQTINFLDDYIKEYCNFGCRYFVLAKTESFLQYEKLIKNYKGTIPLDYQPKTTNQTKAVVTTPNRNPFGSGKREKKPHSSNKRPDKSKDDFLIKTKTKKNQGNPSKNHPTSAKQTNNANQKKANNAFVIKKQKSQTNRG
ncbi:YutD family protein [Fundicoccus culcitae]|uniref:YutD family protein n=1 Tax=Fundicoccus culcitae TaxID=2969821 RepID=A0ABY5P790_9LACT|nr:YutD family protein [Fundicoccus culcitae]UUX34308.1 YutD family protein [Fundicoccus culcitae]